LRLEGILLSSGLEGVFRRQVKKKKKGVWGVCEKRGWVGKYQPKGTAAFRGQNIVVRLEAARVPIVPHQ
jgi:hypothetical protein